MQENLILLNNFSKKYKKSTKIIKEVSEKQNETLNLLMKVSKNLKYSLKKESLQKLF